MYYNLQGATIFRRWLFMLGSLFFLRGISIIVTMLPNPLPNCETEAAKYNPFVGGIKILMGEITTCADVLYSGHTVNLSLCALIWNEFSSMPGAKLFDWDPLGNFFSRGKPAINEAGHRVRTTTTKALVWAYTIVGYVMIIATKFHYSIGKLSLLNNTVSLALSDVLIYSHVYCFCLCRRFHRPLHDRLSLEILPLLPPHNVRRRRKACQQTLPVARKGFKTLHSR